MLFVHPRAHYNGNATRKKNNRYEQFQNVMKLGPLSRVMSMIPGLPQGLAQKGGEKEGADRIRRFMFMMDSMNDSELDGKNIHQDGEAIMRIARGSGTAPEEVHALLQYHKQMEKMVGKMGKTSLMKGDKKLNSQVRRGGCLPNCILFWANLFSQFDSLLFSLIFILF